jgi:hypothetical protein
VLAPPSHMSNGVTTNMYFDISHFSALAFHISTFWILAFQHFGVFAFRHFNISHFGISSFQCFYDEMFKHSKSRSPKLSDVCPFWYFGIRDFMMLEFFAYHAKFPK